MKDLRVLKGFDGNRFTPVVRLDHPQPLSYDNFLESTDATSFEARDLYAAAAESFLQVQHRQLIVYYHQL